MLDSFAPAEGKKTAFEVGLHALDGLPEGLSKRLTPLIAGVEADVDKQRANLEAWYDDTMARRAGGVGIFPALRSSL